MGGNTAADDLDIYESKRRSFQVSDSVQTLMPKSDPYSTIDATENMKQNFFNLSPIKKELFNMTSILAANPKENLLNIQRNYNDQSPAAHTHSPPSQLPETK